MLILPSSLKIFLATFPVDMRKSFDSLAGLTRDYLGENPFSGHIFVFYNKTKNKLKILFWDRNGLCLFYKRIEKGTFKVPSPVSAGTLSVVMDDVQLRMLLDGIDYGKVKRVAAIDI